MKQTVQTVGTVDPIPGILEARQLLPAARLEEVQAKAHDQGKPFTQILLDENVYTRAQLLHMLENDFFCPSVDVSNFTAPADLLTQLAKEFAERFLFLPLSVENDQMVVAFADPSVTSTIDAVQLTTHKKVLPRVAVAIDLEAAIERTYGKLKTDLAETAGTQDSTDRHERYRKHFARGADDVVDDIFLQGDGAPSSRPEESQPGAEAAPPPQPKKKPIAAKQIKVGNTPVEIVDDIFANAAKMGTTDVHINPGETELRVRFRIDGILHTVATVPPDKTPAIVSRIKVMSGLDIAEHRVPQDGRQAIQAGDEVIDLRISTLPSQHGENVVVRLLRKDMSLLNVANLNMPPPVRELHDDMVTSPLGMYLVTGPTGSGKTTTLYATLNEHDADETNIITLEDPIEYQLPGIVQVQIRDDAGLTFAAGLRSILRQDPEVVLVGEIRDLETVEIAARAALTGHKVLSTLHTNDACQAVTRLLDMGVAPHMLTATLKGVLAQRLIRLNCPDCTEEYEANDTEHALLGYPSNRTLRRGTGCETCANTGYKGRSAIFEYFKVEESIHRLIIDRASPYVVRHAAERNGMITMGEFAKKAVLDGKTTVTEIQRVIFSSESREQLCGNCQRVVAMDFTVCPFCQHVLKEACGNCGNPLDSSWEACPTCGNEVEREWAKVFCRNCLAPVDQKWSACRYCGVDL